MPKNSYKKIDRGYRLRLKGSSAVLAGFYNIALLLLIAGIASYSSANEMDENFPGEKYSAESRTIRIKPLMQTSPLGDAAITSVLKQKNGQLWVSEQSGLHLHDGRKLVSFNTLRTGSHYAPSIDISSITEDRLGDVWASSRSAGITKYHAETGTFQHVQGLPNSGVSHMVYMGDDTIIYIHNYQLHGYRTNRNYPNLDLRQHWKTIGAVSRIQTQDDKNAIIFSDRGIFRLDIDDYTIASISPLTLHTHTLPENREHTTAKNEARENFRNGTPIQISKSRDSTSASGDNSFLATAITTSHRNLFFAGTDEGLYVFTMDGTFLKLYNTRNSGITNDHITHLHSDGEILWVGTYEGLSYLEISEFELYDYYSDKIANEVLNFSSDQFGNIWLGTYDGIFQFNPSSKSHIPLTAKFPQLALVDERVMALSVTESEILIGTRRSGLFIIDLTSGNLVDHNIQGNEDLEVTKIMQVSKNAFLVSSFNHGLYILNKDSSRKIARWDAEKIMMEPITILERHGGDVISANEKSVYVHHIGSQDFKKIDVVFPQTESQPIITALHSISRDIFLIGTQSHGLFSVSLIDEDNEGVDAISELKEIRGYSTGVWAIERDTQNRLWIATSSGLFLYSPDLEFLRRYSAADGLQGNKFNFGASFADADGFLYFGGSKGYVRFHPSRIPSYTSPPSIRITGINFSDTKYRTTTKKEDVESILLSHKDLLITFEFSALDYTDLENTRYRHKLVGFDTDWVDIGNRDSATYTSLPPGEYVFRVQAMNSAGIWNYDGLTVGLEVMPAPWNTWWANTLYALAAIIILAGAFRYQRNNMLRDQDLARTKEMQRIADRVADDLQDQMEFQANFSNSMDHYNKQLLYWTKFCTDTTAEYEPANTALAYDRIRFRLDVLSLIQDSLFYRGEQLYAELPMFVNLLVKKLHDENPEGCERLNSVNDVDGELVPAAQVIPIAIIFAELFDNSVKHAFARNSESRFIRFSLTITPNNSFNSDTFHLVYQDNGYGIPPGLSFESPESAGFAIIQHAAERLRGEIEISEQDRNLISASFNLPWTQRKP